MGNGCWWSPASSRWVGAHPREETWAMPALALRPDRVAGVEPQGGRRGGGSAAPQKSRGVGVNSTVISGRGRASSQSPHSWTLRAGAANRKKMVSQSASQGGFLFINQRPHQECRVTNVPSQEHRSWWLAVKKLKIPTGGQKAAARGAGPPC